MISDNSPIGKFASQTGLLECQPCPMGTYADVPGLSQCRDCDFGNYMNHTGATECDLCIAGKHNDIQQQTACQDCAIGRYSSDDGENICRQCELGEYGGNQTGLTACYQCPGNSDTGDLTGAIYESSCACSIGYYGNAFAVCYPCIEGGACDQFNLTVPNTAAGYWRANANADGGFKRCDPPESCLYNGKPVEAARIIPYIILRMMISKVSDMI